MKIKGLGAKRIRTLYAELGIDSLDSLEEAARAGRIATLPGFGAKTVTSILDGVASVRDMRGKRRIVHALDVAERLVEHVRTLPGVSAAELAGPLRRRMEVVSSIDLVAATDRAEETLAAFRTLGEHTAGGGERSGRAEVRFSDGFAASLACVPADRFGAALAVWTGSEAHVAELAERARVRWLTFGRTGSAASPTPTGGGAVRGAGARLGAAGAARGVGRGGGRRGRDAAAPRGAGDLRGTFHCHTTYSDGRATLAEMAEGARARGWTTWGSRTTARSHRTRAGSPRPP
jgi:DNA polymerase (family 10)